MRVLYTRPRNIRCLTEGIEACNAKRRTYYLALWALFGLALIRGTIEKTLFWIGNIGSGIEANTFGFPLRLADYITDRIIALPISTGVIACPATLWMTCEKSR